VVNEAVVETGTAQEVGIRLLGGFEVVVGGRVVPAKQWRRRSASALVKLLSLQLDRRMVREQVVDALWPDLTLEAAVSRLHVAAHHARTTLGSREAVVVADGLVSLFPGAEVTVDVEAFDQAADAALAEGAAETAMLAAAGYSGVLLPDDLYEPWTEGPRDRLRLRHLELLRTAGRYEDLVAADPLDEEAQLALVDELVRQGRRQAALRALTAMDDLFLSELGLEPSAASVSLRRRAERLPVLAPRRSALPPPRNRLIGRDADLAAVAGLLRDHRVVTVTGPGGAGKSTLALAVARSLLADAELPGDLDVVLAELAPVRADADVPRAVAEAAGIQGEATMHAQTLAAILGPRRVLLLLDNCEHLLTGSATLVDAVLDAGDGARVLVTSREPLQVDGEAVHRIGSLGAGSAALFVERAVEAAGVGAASVDDPRVVELCRRLDGLPLAIELAAAQLRHLGLAQLVDRLDDRLALLVGRRPKAGSRHSALTATIEWSYRLLSGPARDLFVRLGVFPATFDLETVEAVAGTPAADTTRLLGDLVAKSLVVHDAPAGRYRLLETLRLFAAQRLDESGLREETTELLRRHVVARSSALPRVRTWLSTSVAATGRDDLDNVRVAFEASLRRHDLTAAVDVALGVSTLWRNAVSYAEGRRWVAELLEQALEPRDRLWTLLMAADVGLGSGDPRMLNAAAQDADVLAAHAEDEGASLIGTTYRAMAQLVTPALAVPALEEVSARARAAGEPGLERLARAYRVVALRIAGRTSGLEAEVRALARGGSEDGYDRYICLWAASLVALVDRDGRRLRELMDAQVADLTASGLRENWLTMYWGALTQIAAGQDYTAQLRRSRFQAEAEGRDANADCVLALGYAAACRGEWERAAELLGATATTLRRDTAGFIHHILVRDQLVAPHLPEEAYAAATSRGELLDLRALVDECGL
jgi:predicted ATPase/DNA-binding SARP family transcriptional activator